MTIFLSYSRSDAQKADSWLANLEYYGYRIWIDRVNIPGGQQWMKTIVRSIQEAQAVLLLLSPNSVRSDNVRREIDIAVQYKKRIIPLELQTTRIPEEFLYQLAGVQILQVWRDARGGLSLVTTALREAGVAQGPVRTMKTTSPRRESTNGGSMDANVDLSDLGDMNFLRRIALWWRK